MTSAALAVPVPGMDLVPDDWWQDVVVPWADEQSESRDVAVAAAQVAGMIEAYRTLGSDTLELTKARRYLELRWGELLGEGVQGHHSLSDSHASESGLSKDDRHRFRQLAGARTQVLELLERATEPDEITRAACVRVAKPASSPRDAIGMLGSLEDDDEPEPENAGGLQELWQQPHDRRRRKILELLDAARSEIDGASNEGLTAHGISELLRSAETRCRQAYAQLGSLAFEFER